MGEKFDRLIGNFTVKVKEKEYPFSMTMRERGVYSNLRKKDDDEKLIEFLFKCFSAGYVKDHPDANKGELEAFECEISDLLIHNYESITIEIMIVLGVISREEVEVLEKKRGDPDFLSDVVVKGMRS